MDASSIIRKTGADRRLTPNFVDFAGERERFSWEAVGRELTTDAEQLAAAQELIAAGAARYVLVSKGARGALLASRDGGRRFAPVPVPAGSGVGAGDAMVAGIAVGLIRGWELSQAVRLGIAAGAAKLLTPGTAPCTREDTERLFEQTDNPVDVNPVAG